MEMNDRWGWLAFGAFTEMRQKKDGSWYNLVLENTPVERIMFRVFGTPLPTKLEDTAKKSKNKS